MSRSKCKSTCSYCAAWRAAQQKAKDVKENKAINPQPSAVTPNRNCE